MSLLISQVSIYAPIIVLLLFVMVLTLLAFCRRRITSSILRLRHHATDHEMSLKLLDTLSFGPRRFSYADLRAATSDFSEARLLGRGGFGCVYKGVIVLDEETTVAIKRMAENSRQGEREFHAEVLSTGRVRHRNLVSLLGWCHERGELLLVYEFMAKGSLDQHLYRKAGHPTLPWPSRLQILKGIASALDYLHGGWDKCILHSDIKPSNVLLDSHMTARLGDFGLARLVGHTFVSDAPKTSQVGGTLGYMAPEVYLDGKLTKKADVYSFGMVALEVVCAQRPPGFQSEDEDDALVETVWKAYHKGQLLEVMDPCLVISSEMQHEVTSVLQLGLLCTLLDPSLRPPTNRLLQGLNGDLGVSLPASRLGYPVPCGNSYAVSFGDHSFSYAEIRAATEDFNRVVGRGRYGYVYNAFMNHQEVAVKRVSPNSESHAHILNFITRSRHRNLVSLLGWCYENGELLLVYEYMERSCLAHHLHSNDASLPWASRFKILQGVAAALDYLHSECQETCIVHEDVSPTTVMLDKHMTAKLAEFGLSHIAGHETLEEHSPYAAPELRKDSPGSVQSDVYSFGMLALEVVCGRPPLVPGEQSLVHWVWSMHQREQLLEVVDPSLGSASYETTEGGFDFHEVKSRQQMTRVLQLGMSCTLPEPSLRPHSNRLIQAMYGDWSISLPVLPPFTASHLASSTSHASTDQRESNKRIT